MTYRHVADSQIARNAAVHDRLVRRYEKVHGEIFNAIEQQRLRGLLERAVHCLGSISSPPVALDVGCGSGNLTGHLLDLGLVVTAADVAARFLDLVSARYAGGALNTCRLNGKDLSELGDESFDFVATYSVLHHIPDYLRACAELARVCRLGGVVLIDHEASPNVWRGDLLLEAFRREATRFDWRKYATPSNYLHRLRRVFDPRYSNEGDIHVWPDDHIEWEKIVEVMRKSGCEPVLEEDYLLYRQIYRAEVYDRYKCRCVDTRAMLFRRKGPSQDVPASP